MAAGHVDGAGDVPLAPLVRLTDVDEERRVGAVEELAGARGVHLVDLGLDLRQQFPIGRHDFQEYSDSGLGRASAGTLAAVGARSRVLTVVALAAAAAVAGTVGVTLLQTRGETTKTAPSSAAVTRPRAGAPPLVLDFGVRAD